MSRAWHGSDIDQPADDTRAQQFHERLDRPVECPTVSTENTSGSSASWLLVYDARHGEAFLVVGKLRQHKADHAVATCTGKWERFAGRDI